MSIVVIILCIASLVVGILLGYQWGYKKGYEIVEAEEMQRKIDVLWKINCKKLERKQDE